jgi:hypothetical protein
MRLRLLSCAGSSIALIVIFEIRGDNKGVLMLSSGLTTRPQVHIAIGVHFFRIALEFALSMKISDILVVNVQRVFVLLVHCNSPWYEGTTGGHP